MSTVDSLVIQAVSDSVDLLRLHELNPSRYPYLLQSVAQSVGQTHYDILFAWPQQSLVLRSDGALEIQDASGTTVSDSAVDGLDNPNGKNDFLAAFQRMWQLEKKPAQGNTELPFRGGWFLFLGYELAQQIEPGLQLPKASDNSMPVAYATRIPAAVIVNRRSGQCCIVAEHAYHDSLQAIVNDIDKLGAMPAIAADNDEFESTINPSVCEEDPQRYLESVEQIKRYIKDGDVFQVNLSRLWTAMLDASVSNSHLYRRLTQTNPAPYFALAVFGEHAIISSSPERLVKVSGDRVDTRPIAGTRPRGDSPENDEAHLRELIAHPKERAEHIMLIDLERNDLGRVCMPGSVKVNELMVLESYAHVHHIVSNVQGQLRQTCTPSDVIRAVFPGGTITGCPKVRCMEIIAELERAPRGAYTGSLGYVNHDGSLDLNILIRTLLKSGQVLSFRAGAGIVADSDPQQELQETRAKAKGLLLAL